MRPPPKRAIHPRTVALPPPPPQPPRPAVQDTPPRHSERDSGHVEVAFEACDLTRDGDRAGSFNGILRITNRTGRALKMVVVRVEFIVNSMEVGSLAEDANSIANDQDRRWPFTIKLLTWFKEAEQPFEWNALVQSDGVEVPVRMAGVSWTPKSKCYVVTACTGDPDNETVCVFREFRDRCLARSRLGRAFISGYELIGPSCAGVIRRHPRLRHLSQRLLVGLVPVTKIHIRRAQRRKKLRPYRRPNFPGNPIGKADEDHMAGQRPRNPCSWNRRRNSSNC
jgi:hypothetical protein